MMGSLSLFHTKDSWRDQSVSSALKIKSPDIAKYMSNKGLVIGSAENWATDKKKKKVTPLFPWEQFMYSTLMQWDDITTMTNPNNRWLDFDKLLKIKSHQQKPRWKSQ